MIADGDLVLVVRWPHPCASSRIGLGWLFTVDGIENADVLCGRCGGTIRGPLAGYRPAGSDTIGIPVLWLKKLDPGADPQSVERETEAAA